MIYGYCFNVLCKLEYVSSSSNINPNPGGIANMTSKYQNGCVKFIIHAKNVKKLSSSIRAFCFILKKQVFYQNDVLIDYFIKMWKVLHILGLCVDGSRVACSFYSLPTLGSKK
jgi:hypothetical protein